MRYRLIVLGFLFSIGLISVSGFFALNATHKVLKSMQEGEEHYNAIAMAATEASSYAKRAEGHLLIFLALHRKADEEKFPERIKSLDEQISILDKKIKNIEANAILVEPEKQLIHQKILDYSTILC